jgi:drug/metabolite transporter (DMT)-like permease
LISQINEYFLFSILASACFGGAMVLTRLGLKEMSPMSGALVSIPTTTLLFWCAAPFMVEKMDWPSTALGIFAVVGLFYPVMVTLLNFEGTLRMGPTRAATISSTTPLFAITGAVLFLRESLTLIIFLGTLGVVAGVMMISWKNPDTRQTWSKISILLPLGAAFIRGGAQMLTKMGLKILPDPFLAGLIGYTASVAFLLLVFQLRFGLGNLAPNKKGAAWFMLVGITNGSAVLFLYSALKTANVITVAPIVATFPLFTLVFSLLFFRREIITRRTLAGVALTVGGVVLISV